LLQILAAEEEDYSGGVSAAVFRFKGRHGLLQMHGIPEDDRGDDQIEPTRFVLQIVRARIPSARPSLSENRRAPLGTSQLAF